MFSSYRTGIAGTIRRRLVALLMLALLGLGSAVNVMADVPDLFSKTGWTAIMFGVGKDPSGDSQAGASDTDIVADANHGSLYTGYNSNGTATIADDYLYFRLRIDNPTAPNSFQGIAVIGMDANLDGKIDLFIQVDARSNDRVITLLDPGSSPNTSPSTTSMAPFPTGWLANNGTYAFTANNFSSVAVNSTTDPNWNGNMDLGNDGNQDGFVSCRIPLADIAAALAIPSPVDRYGNYGPRGTTGIQGYNQNTIVQYVSFTQTQPGPINGDLNGVGASYDKNATWGSLGAFTAPMSAANPISSCSAAAINTPVDPNNLISFNEAASFVVSGTAIPTNSWVMLTISDTNSGTADIVVWAHDTNGVWSSTNNLNSLSDGPLTFTAVLVTGNGVTNLVANSSGASATATHDTVGPIIGINSLTTTGRPVISGTSTDVPAGSTITVTVDPNGDGILTDQVTFTAVVDASGNWSVDTSAVSPTSGTMPSSGFTAYATVKATGADAAGNTTTVTAVDKPTVNTLLSNSTTPTITGYWGGTNGGTDTLSVTIDGHTYTQGGGQLTVSGDTWTLVIPPGNALTTNNSPYNVTTTVTRSGTPYSNVTTAAVSIVSGPSISITSASTQATSKPTISGGSTVTNGTATIRITNSTLVVYYSVTTDSSGNWTFNTATNTPYSGTYPLAGVTGTLNVFASITDTNGVTATATQTLTLVIPTISITSITSTATTDANAIVNNADTYINRTEDKKIVLTGTTANAVGQTVTIAVSDNDPSTTDLTTTALVASDGKWTNSAWNISAMRDGVLTFTATVSGVSASNSSYTHDATPPHMAFTMPNTLKKTAPVITIFSDLPTGSTIVVTNNPSTGSFTNTVDSSGNWTTGSGGFPGANWSNPTTVGATSTNTDVAGNFASAITVVVNAGGSSSGTTTVTITNITGWTYPSDQTITTNEIGSGITIGGNSTTTGTLNLLITDGVTNYTFSALSHATAGGPWTATLTKAQVLNLINGTLTITATLNDSGASPADTNQYSVWPILDLRATPSGAAPTITLTQVGDSDLSASEVSAVNINGTSANAVGQTVNISVTDGVHAAVTATATVTASGTWTNSAVNLSGLNDGSLTVSVSVTANNQTATDSGIVQKSTVAPTIQITSGPTSTNLTPTISGTSTLPAGSTITVSIDTGGNGTNIVTYSVVVGTGGTWSVNTATTTPTTGTFPASGLSASSVVTVTGSDPAGNSTTATSTSVTAITTDTGLSSTDFLTSDPTLIFTGRAKTNGTVVIFLNGTAVNTNTSNASGVWTFDYTGTTLGQGTYTLIASNNVSGGIGTATQLFTIDTTAPSLTFTGISPDSGSSSTDQITATNKLSYSGTAEVGSSVTVTLKDANNNTIYSTSVAPNSGGNWSVDETGTTLPDGTYTLTILGKDAAGNTTTITKTIVIDTTASITITTSPSTSNTKPVITGTTDLENGQIITVKLDLNNNGIYTDDGATNTYTATVTNGTWSVTTTNTLAAGTIGIQATGSDIAGNLATATKSLTISPTAPTIVISTPIDSGGDGILDGTEDNSVTIHGFSTNIVNGSTLTVLITDGTHSVTDTTTVTNNVWSYAPFNLSSFANGTITVTVSYLDSFGNTYTSVATVTHNKSTTVSIDSISPDTGTPGDFITKANTNLVISGSATASASVALTMTGPGTSGFTNTVSATTGGSWSFNYISPALADGTYTLKAVVGTTTNTQTIVIDTTPPAGPVNISATGLSTTNTTPTITGTVTIGAGETFSVTVNGVTYHVGDGNLTTNGSGGWSLTIPAANALGAATGSGGFDGNYTVTATLTDTAGNTLSTSATLNVTVNPVLTVATGGGAISADSTGGAYTALTGPSYTEGLAGQITTGTLILKAPSGFQFDTGGTAPTLLVTRVGSVGSAASDINGVASGSTIAATSVSASQIVFTITSASTNGVPNQITWQNVRVRPTAGTPLTTGDLLLAGTGSLANVTNNSTSLGTLTEVPGSLSGYAITAATGTPTAGSGDQLTIKLVDQFGNTVTNFTGTKTLTFSGLGTSPGGSAPTITDNTGSPITLGSPTTISFTNGVSSLGGLLIDYKAETATLNATDGTNSTTTTGGSGQLLTVSAGTVAALAYSQQPANAHAGYTFGTQPVIRTVDSYGNPSTSGLGANLNVTEAIKSGTGTVGAVLSGTTTLNIGTSGGNGTVSFSNLAIDLVGTAYKLTASASGLTAADSSAFDVKATNLLTPATGGSAISADTTSASGGTGAYTTLTGPTYQEDASGEVGTGTITLNAPSGFQFDTGGTAPTILVTRLSGSGPNSNNINGVASGSTIAVTSVSASQIVFTITSPSSSGVVDQLTWQNVRVRPTAGTPLATGNMVDNGTASVAFVTNNVSNFGTLTEVPGSLSGYKITAVTSTPTAGGGDQLTIKLVDQFGNTVTNFTGTKTLTFSGLGTSPGGSAPTITDNTGTPITLGSPTTISFTNGVSSLGGLLIDYKAETATLNATDGTNSTSTSGGSGQSLTVSAATASLLAFTQQVVTAHPGYPFGTQPIVRSEDAYGNFSTSGLPANLPVTVAIKSGTGTLGAALSGTATLDIGTSAGNGTVAYSNLSIDLLGTAYKLTASASGLTSADSAAFNVVPANVLTPATGGSAISADTTSASGGSGAFTTLTGPVYQEDETGEVGTGTITLNAPSGFQFDTGGTAPTILVTRLSGSGPSSNDINGVASGSTIAVTSVSASQIVFTITSPSSNGVLDQLTWQNVRVRPTAGTPLASGNMVDNGTASVAFVTNNVSNFGTLTEVPGALSGYKITAVTTTPTAGSGDQLTIKLVDQFGNTVTNFTGDVSLTFSGLGTSPNGNGPTITDKTGTPVALGTPTTISFTNGVISLGGLLKDFTAESATLNATDGTYSTTTTGGSGLPLTVSAATASALVYAQQPSNAHSGVTFGTQPIVKSVDTYGNPSTSGLPASLTVTVAIKSGTGTGGAVLSGTKTLDIGTGAGNGTVSYSNLSIDLVGTAYQLTATGSGLGSVDSSAFDVNVSNNPPVPSYAGSALLFNGVNNYVRVASPFTGFTNQITVEWWVNVTSFQAGAGIGQATENVDNSASNVWLMHGNTDGSVDWQVNDSGAMISLNTGTLSAGWHHLAGVANSIGTYLYVDGTQVTNTTGITTGIVSNPSAVIHMGKDVRYASSAFMNGSIDEVRVWGVARTADQISEMYQQRLNGTESGLVAYYRFDDGTGTTLADSTGNGHTGALVNSPTWQVSSAGVDRTKTLEQVDTFITLSGFDADGDTTTAKITTLPTNGSLYQYNGGQRGSLITATPTTVTDSGHRVVYVANTGTLADSIAYKLNDGLADSASAATVNIEVKTISLLSAQTMHMDGTGQYLITPNLRNLFPDTSVTIEVWFYANGPGVIVDELGNTNVNTGWHDSQIEVVDQGGGMGEVRVRVWNLPPVTTVGVASTGVSLGTVSYGTWNHAVVRYNQNARRLDGLLNGVASGTPVTGDRLVPWSNIIINNLNQAGRGGIYYAFGTHDVTHLGSGAAFDGYIDEVRIWNRPRTDAEIASDYKSELTGTENGLVAWYRFDDLTNPGLDYKGTNNLTILNGATQAVSAAVINQALATVSFDQVIVLPDFLPATVGVTPKITALPVNGVLYQYNNGARGAVIANVPTVVTDPMLRVIYAPVADSQYDYFKYVLNDGTSDSAQHIYSIGISPNNTAPVLTGFSTLAGGTEDTPYTITYASLLAAASVTDAESDPISFQLDKVQSGSLTKNGVAAVPGITTLGLGESWVWTPATNVNSTINGGPLSALTAYAYDGRTTSASSQAVKVDLSAVNDAPVTTFPGTAVKLNGTNQFIVTPNLALSFPNESETISVLFRANGPGVIMSERSAANGSGWHDSQIEVLTNGNVMVRVWNLTPVLVGQVNFGEWHTIVLRYSKENLLLDGFLDGVACSLPSSGDRQTPLEGGFSGLYYAFGAGDVSNLGSGNYLDGQIAEVQIWNVARSQADIKATYRGSLIGSEPGLVALYRTTEGTGTVLHDASSSANNGSIGNSASWTNNFPGAVTNTDIVITLTGFDPDGDALAAAYISVMPTNGVLYQYVGGVRGAAIGSAGTQVTDSSFRVIYAAGSGYSTDAFSYQVSDGSLNSADGQVNVRVVTSASLLSYQPGSGGGTGGNTVYTESASASSSVTGQQTLATTGTGTSGGAVVTPVPAIISPANGAQVTSGDTMDFVVLPNSSSPLVTLEFYVDGELVGYWQNVPGAAAQTFEWVAAEPGQHQFQFIVNQTGIGKTQSPMLNFTVGP